MAIGARISSENLSGKTATVTFTPYTGVTSGTTVNLGTKTIPFNNINTHPYGIYSLYLAEYDYTYSLTIPEPVTEAQLFVYVDRMTNSDNYGAAMLNFTDFTAEVIDLGVDSTYWSNNNVRPLQNSGFMYEFNGDNDYQEKLIIFTDASGSEIGRYTGTTDNYNADSLDGRLLTYEDEDNGVLTYSNGTSVHTYTWDSSTHYIDIEYDWDASTSDGTFIIKKYENGNNGGQSYLVNSNDGTTTLFKTWEYGTDVNHVMQVNTDFIVVETRLSGEGYTYTNLEICDTSGGVLEAVSLTGNTYYSRNREFLGSNKFCVVYYNNYDDSVDYKIIHYNGDTETLTQTSHVHGANYTDFNLDGDSDFWPNGSTVNGGVVITFYHNIEYSNLGSVVDYYEIVYMLKNQTSFSTYELADGESIIANTSGQLSNIYRAIIGRGDFFEFLTITSTGQTITTTQLPISGITNTNTYYLGDRSIYAVLSNDNIDINVYLVNEYGTILDTLTETLSSSYNYSIDSEGSVLYVRLLLSGDTTESYYVYSGSTGFTLTDSYNNRETADTHYSDTFLDASVMVLTNLGSSSGFRVLSLTGITSELSFPDYDGYSLRVGRNGFMFVYSDPNDSNYVKINLYNLSGVLVNSHTTEYTGWDDTYGIGDRFVIKFNNDGYNEYFMVSEETITSVSLDSYSTEWVPNDYIWWDDY